MERRCKMCKSQWNVKYRSRSPGQGTCQISTSRRSTMQDMVVVGLIIEKLSNINVKCVKYRSRSPGQDTSQASTMRWSTMQGLVVVGLIFEEILNINVKWVKGNGVQIGQGHRVKVPAKSVHREGALYKVWWLKVEDIWKGGIKGVKVNGVRNVGQGHRVKLPADSVHWGEALCKVWWL